MRDGKDVRRQLRRLARREERRGDRELGVRHEAHIDTSAFAELDDEITGALPHVEVSYSKPGKAIAIAQSISFDPRGTKRFYVCDPEGGTKTAVDASIYWFNDMDYHGIDPDPFFRSSIRVDGIFDPTFAASLVGSPGGPRPKSFLRPKR